MSGPARKTLIPFQLYIMNATLTPPQTNRCQTETSPKSAPASERYVSPRVEIQTRPGSYTLRADLPGVDKSGLEIQVHENELHITGRRTATPEPGEVLHRESLGLDYRRVFALDASIDAAKISARLDQGVLTVTLPQVEAAKPRTIKVTS